MAAKVSEGSSNKESSYFTENEDGSLTLSQEFSDKTLHLNGTTLRVNKEGDLFVVSGKNVFVQEMDGHFVIAPPKAGQNIQGTTVSEKVEIGDVMPDGTVFVGFSYDGKGLYTLGKALPSKIGENSIGTFIKEFNAAGYSDWRLPYEDERHTIYENRYKGALKDILVSDNSHDYYGCIYWVTYGRKYKAGYKSLSSENFYETHNEGRALVAPVRSGPLPKGLV